MILWLINFTNFLVWANYIQWPEIPAKFIQNWSRMVLIPWNPMDIAFLGRWFLYNRQFTGIPKTLLATGPVYSFQPILHIYKSFSRTYRSDNNGNIDITMWKQKTIPVTMLPHSALNSLPQPFGSNALLSEPLGQLLLGISLNCLLFLHHFDGAWPCMRS